MGQQINLKNIKAYIEGNSQMLLDELGMQPEWYKEQIAYRMLKCKDDCVPNGKCTYCGCKVPGKMYVTESCNYGGRFPDLMNEEQWLTYKEDYGIE